MIRVHPLPLGALTLLLVVGCGDADSAFPEPKDPTTASVTAIDRFQSSFATLYNRASPQFDPATTTAIIPAPDAPIDMDAGFLIRSLGPAGARITYYALDVSESTPVTAYTVHGGDGVIIEGQLPILTSIPGDPGHTDFVRVVEVWVGDSYVANSFTSAAEVEEVVARGAAVIVDEGRIANWALVPAGTTANTRFAGNPVSGFTAWHEGRVAHYLRFDTALQAGGDGDSPAANVSVIFANGSDPGEGFATEADGRQTHNVVELLPGQPGYSSLWAHQVGRLSGFASVRDWPTATANFQEKLTIKVNCPVVSE